jgi:hypothetical protein
MASGDAERYILETLEHYDRNDCIWMIPAGVPLVWYGPIDEGKPREWEVEIKRNAFLATHKCVIQWEEDMKPVISSIAEKQRYRPDPVAGATELNDGVSEAFCGDKVPAQDDWQSAQTNEGPETTPETIQQTNQTDTQTNRESMDSAASGFDGMTRQRLEHYDSDDDQEGLVPSSGGKAGSSAWSRMKKLYRR